MSEKESITTLLTLLDSRQAASRPPARKSPTGSTTKAGTLRP